MSFNFIDLAADFTCKKIANTMARSIASYIEKMWNFACAEIIRLQKAQAITVN